MGRKATLRRKGDYWASDFGGKTRRFGRCSDVPYEVALSRFHEALEPDKQGGNELGGKSSDWKEGTNSRREVKPLGSFLPASGTNRSPLPYIVPQEPISVADLRTLFLAWLERYRGERTHYERSRHLLRFVEAHGKRKASEITGTHLEAFLALLAKRGAALDWQHKHEVSVRAMYRWGVKYGHLPTDHKPFATMEPIRLPAKALLEADLPTSKEVKALLVHATPTLAALLRVQYATGARSGELLNARVGDYQPTTQQIVLRHHNREKTMREPRPRAITLNKEANAIVETQCRGREASAPLFLTPSGKCWSDKLFSYHFGRARAAAGVRDSLTPYAFRHLWISEALMAGTDALLVARMAGTSVSMIERVYGHFRNQSLADAQAKIDALRRV